LGEQRKEEIGKKIERGSYQVGIQQKCYTDGMTKGLMKSTRDGWRGIGTNGREKEGSTRKKRKKKMRQHE